MDGISQLSNHSILTDMDLFEKETSQNLYTCTPRYQEFKPLHSLTDRGPFHFEFWSPKDMYLLNTLRFTLTVRIVEDDGTVEGKALKPEYNGKFSVVNTFAHSLWDNIGQELENVTISDNSRRYGNKAYLLQTYSYSSTTKRTNMNCELFHEDDTAQSSDVNSECKGFRIRGEPFYQSRDVQMSFVPYLDFASNQHFLAPGHKLALILERARDEWSILCTDPNLRLKIKIVNLTAHMRAVTPLPQLSASIERKLATTSIEYSMTRNIIRSYTVTKGTSFVNVENIFRGTLPRAIYCYFQDNNQVQPTFASNPYVLRPYNLREASVNINGVCYPTRPVRIDFEKNHVMEAYRFLLDNLGVGDTDVELDVSIDQYPRSYFILAFDLSPVGDNGCVPHVPGEGALSFNAVLAAPTPHPITLMVHAVFENKVTVDKNRQIQLDYTV